MKKALCWAICLVLLCTTAACGGTRSRYNAIGFVHSGDSRHLDMSFFSLKGTYVHTLRVRDTQQTELHYSASLDEGELSVLIERDGGSELLFTIGAGETADAHGFAIKNGERIRLVVQAQDCSEGKLHICFAE